MTVARLSPERESAIRRELNYGDGGTVYDYQDGEATNLRPAWGVRQQMIHDLLAELQAVRAERDAALDGFKTTLIPPRERALRVELDAVIAERDAAVKVAEAAKTLSEVLEAREGSDEWAAFTALLLALAAWSVSATTEGDER